MKMWKPTLTLLMFALTLVLVSCSGGSSGAGAGMSDDPEAAPGPYGKKMYVRGTTVGGWEPRAETVMTFEDGKYVATVQVESGDTRFKVADAFWSNCCNLGAGDPEATIGGNVQMELNKVSGDIYISVAEAGSYTFTVDTADPKKPTLMITKAE